MVSSSLQNDVFSSANEEWPELIHFGKVSEVMTVKTVFEPPKPKTIALKNITAEDLESIEKQDKFLYYSIPGVRSARLLGKDIDTSDLGTNRIKSCPARLGTQQGTAQSLTTVTRSKRISFECHPDILFEDMLEDMLNSDEDIDLEGVEEDPLDYLFLARSR